MAGLLQPPVGHPIVWIALFGAFGALLVDHAGGFWIGAFCGYLFDRLRQAEHAIAVLRARVDIAQRHAAAGTAGADNHPRPPDARPGPVSATVAAPADSPAEPTPEPLRTPVDTNRPPTVLLAPTWRDRLLERARGGNPLARLGVLITFIGAVYLIRYAAEEGWLPIELRLVALMLGGLAMVASGWRLRPGSDRAGESYGLILQGGGFALLYLTVLAAFRLYALIAPGAAFTLLAATAAAAAALAVRQHASLLAMIGFAGGYAAPLLIGGDGGPHALFSYYAVLGVGVLAIVAARGWTRLALMAFVFTFVVSALWRGTRYQPEWFASTEGFLFGYWALFIAMTVLAAVRDPARGWLSSTLTFGLPAVVMALQVSLVERHEAGIALTSVGLGLAYAALAFGCHRASGQRPALGRLADAFAAIAVVLLTLAVPLRYDAELTAAAWALEGAGAVWLGIVQQRRLLRAFGIGVQLIAGLQLIEAFDAGLATAGPFAAGVPAALLLALAGFFCAVRLRAVPEPRLPGEQWIPATLVLWSLGFWLWAGLEQLALWLPSERTASGLALAGVTIAALGIAEARLSWRWLNWPARALFGVASLGGLIAALFDHPFDGAATFGWLLLFAGLVSLLARRAADDASKDLPLAATHIGAVLVALLVLMLELAWQLRNWPGGNWPRLAWGAVPIALLVLLAARRTDRWIYGNGPLYRSWIAGGLGLLVLAWAARAGFGTAGSAAPWAPTMPLLNPFDLLALVGFAVVAQAWRRREPADFAAVAAWLPLGLFVIAVFAWANGALVRGLHALADTPIDADSWAGSPLLQAGFSLLWSSVGLAMMRSAARRGRTVWLCGAALMLVVALKLFLIDTAGTGTLARIAAFLGVGAILLIAGWLAPMPASDGRRDA